MYVAPTGDQSRSSALGSAWRIVAGSVLGTLLEDFLMNSQEFISGIYPRICSRRKPGTLSWISSGFPLNLENFYSNSSKITATSLPGIILDITSEIVLRISSGIFRRILSGSHAGSFQKYLQIIWVMVFSIFLHFFRNLGTMFLRNSSRNLSKNFSESTRILCKDFPQNYFKNFSHHFSLDCFI